MNRSKDLPSGWTSGTIGNLISVDGIFCDGDWVESEDQDPNGDIRLIQLADIGDGVYRNRSNRFLTAAKAKQLKCTFLKTGDVLIARMPDPLGRAAIFPGDALSCVTVVDVCIARTGHDAINHRWLMHFINSPVFRANIAALQSGSTRKRISRRNLASLQLPIPPSNEQRRIVAKIEELFSDLDAGVAALERAKANLKRYRAAVLKAVVEGSLTAEWRAQHPDVEPASQLLKRMLLERRRKWEADQLAKFQAAGKAPPKNWQAKYVEPTSPNAIDLPELPKSWCWTTIEQMNAAERPISYGVLQPGTEFPGGVPLIRVCDVADGKVAIDQLKKIEPSISDQFRRTIIQGGEVLLTVVGTIGRTAIAPPELVGANTARAVAVIAVAPLCIPEFLELALRDPAMRTRLTLASHEVARKTLNLEDVRVAHLNLPPLEEQKVILAHASEKLSQIEAADKLIDSSLARASRLRQSILKQAFEGRLVPQDPSDEPASVLLQRIQAESQLQPTNGKPTKTFSSNKSKPRQKPAPSKKSKQKAT